MLAPGAFIRVTEDALAVFMYERGSRDAVFRLSVGKKLSAVSQSLPLARSVASGGVRVLIADSQLLIA
jgi:hypothetical protein